MLAYDNVEIYFYQDDKETITNLDNYMDMIHFSKDINRQIYEKLARGEGQLTLENYEKRLDDMYALSEEIVKTEILRYYDN